MRTKLFGSRLQPNLMMRQRLIVRLNQGVMHKFTLISAPAGFGKTTLLTEWRHSQQGVMAGSDSSPPTFAWLALDSDDDDPVHFLRYVVAALQTVQEELGATALSLLQSPQPPAPQTVLGTLINEIAALPQRLVLVLDDYHTISNRAIHEALAYLLTHLPPQLHLAIATRVDPPLPLARMRVRGEMTELRAADLRFTTAEAATFLRECRQLDLQPAQVAALEARTEGWIAGLQLAALSLQHRHERAEVSTFVDAFTGSHRYVLDYLVDEVLAQQSTQVQQFLLCSAILKQICAEACNAILEIDDSQPMLEALEAANLFIVPLDEQRRWYRYHHLFAELLRHRLKQTQPDRVPELHRRASDWHQANDLIGEAIEHALAAADTARAVALVCQARWEVHGRGEVATLQRWLRLLPASVVQTTIPLALAQVWTLFYSGKLAEGAACLQQIQAHLCADNAVQTATLRMWHSELAILEAQAALNRGEIERAIAACLQARAALPDGQWVIASMVETVLGRAYRLRGDLAAAAQAYAAAATLGGRTNNPMAVLSGLCSQAALYEVLGQLHEAERLQQAAIALAIDETGRRVPLAGIPLLGLGKLYREWNRLETAAAWLEEAIALGRRAGLEGIVVDSVVTLALVHMAQGADAHATLRQGQEIVQRWQEPLTALRLAALAARLWLAQGNIAAAAAWADAILAEYSMKQLIAGGEQVEIEQTILARIWLAQGRVAEAQELLAQLLAAAEATGRKGRVVEVLVLQALAARAGGALAPAIDTLCQALQLAQPAGYVRVFADEGRPMGELVARVALEESPLALYARQLLPAFAASAPESVPLEVGSAATDQTTGQPPQALSPEMAHWLAEPLSVREREVLALLAEGYNNREIGKRLIIAISTVKKHIEHIHGKLYVRSRTQAVARARTLGLL